jgi:hypothetical protein
LLLLLLLAAGTWLRSWPVTLCILACARRCRSASCTTSGTHAATPKLSPAPTISTCTAKPHPASAAEDKPWPSCPNHSATRSQPSSEVPLAGPPVSPPALLVPRPLALLLPLTVLPVLGSRSASGPLRARRTKLASCSATEPPRREVATELYPSAASASKQAEVDKKLRHDTNHEVPIEFFTCGQKKKEDQSV